MEQTIDHYGNPVAVIVWIALYGVLLCFLPYYRKVGLKPKGAFAAFIIAFACEMFGIPFSVYIAGWLFGIVLPEGVFWGHTLYSLIGYWGMYIGILLMLIGAVMIISGWRVIHSEYWSKASGEGHLVDHGIYSRIRHPQYTGLFLISFGMIAEWATIPLVIMYPIIIILYIRLAKREERDMLERFGAEYERYMERTGRFFPKLVMR